jgi:hypothetical protein
MKLPPPPDLSLRISPDTVDQLGALMLAAEETVDVCKCMSPQHRANLFGRVIVARNSLRYDLAMGGRRQ